MLFLAPVAALLATTVLALDPSSVQLAGFHTITLSPASATYHPQGIGHHTVQNRPHPPFNWPPPAQSTTSPGCKKVQYEFPAGSGGNSSRANAVRDLYKATWAQYSKTCFGQDTLQPLNNSCKNDLFGWGASIVDGVDTAIIMNLTEIVKEQLGFIAHIDFTQSTSNNYIDGFDAIIRYLGGLIGAYDLLTSDYVPAGTYDQSLVDALLKQAHTLGNTLKPQFDTPSGLPTANINLTTHQGVNSPYLDPINNVTYNSTNTAVAGTIILEFNRLADLTGDQSFRTLADRAESNLVNPYPATVYPNLVGSNLDIDTGNFLTFDFGWQAGIDSFYEYLIKTYQYDPTLATTQFYKDFWIGASRSTIQNIALSPYNRSNLLFVSEGDVYGNLEWEMDDYACFAGGNWLLGSKLLDLPDVYDLGVRVTDSCHYLYNHTVSGLGPLQWSWYNGSNLAYDPADDTNNTERAEAARDGYFITSPLYDSFPEPLESVFYAHRITGDSRWQEYNWQTFQALSKLMTPNGDVPALDDVNDPTSFVNEIPSFWWAEVLKYLYLTFTPANVISLDEWIFTTEAHPIRRKAGKCEPQIGNNGTHWGNWNDHQPPGGTARTFHT